MKKILTSLMMAFTLTSCGSKNQKTDDVIRVGVPMPLTGDLAQYGVATKQGIELAIEEINNAGGINGKKIEADYQDTKGDIQEVVSIFKSMNSKGVDVYIGEAISANSLVVAELAQKAGVLVVSPTATAMDITQGKDLVFRTTFTDDHQGIMLAKYLVSKGVKEVALLTNSSSDYSIGVAKAFNEVANELGLKVYEQKYTNSDKDFKSVLTKIKNEGYKNVVIPDYYNTIGLILSQAKEIGLEAQYYGADGWDGIQADFSNLAEGAIFSSQFSINDDTPIVAEFVKKYQDKFNVDPLVFSALGYDSVMIYKDAVQKGGDIKTNLENTDLELVTGHVKFDENRNPNKQITFITIENGKTAIKEKFGE